jgi:hypothetical protein
MKTSYGIQKLPVNFDTHFGVQLMTVGNEGIKEENSDDYQEEENRVQYLNDQNESDDEENDVSDNEEMFILLNELTEHQDGTLEIKEGSSEIPIDNRSSKIKVQEALENVVNAVDLKFIAYKEDLRALLFKYIDIFGMSHSDVKQTDVIQFDIDTGNAKPVYIKPRPLPWKYKEIVKKELDTQV